MTFKWSSINSHPSPPALVPRSAGPANGDLSRHVRGHAFQNILLRQVLRHNQTNRYLYSHIVIRHFLLIYYSYFVDMITSWCGAISIGFMLWIRFATWRHIAGPPLASVSKPRSMQSGQNQEPCGLERAVKPHDLRLFCCGIITCNYM